MAEYRAKNARAVAAMGEREKRIRIFVTQMAWDAMANAKDKKKGKMIIISVNVDICGRHSHSRTLSSPNIFPFVVRSFRASADANTDRVFLFFFYDDFTNSTHRRHRNKTLSVSSMRLTSLSLNRNRNRKKQWKRTNFTISFPTKRPCRTSTCIARVRSGTSHQITSAMIRSASALAFKVNGERRRDGESNSSSSKSISVRGQRERIDADWEISARSTPSTTQWRQNKTAKAIRDKTVEA